MINFDYKHLMTSNSDCLHNIKYEVHETS